MGFRLHSSDGEDRSSGARLQLFLRARPFAQPALRSHRATESALASFSAPDSQAKIYTRTLAPIRKRYGYAASLWVSGAAAAPHAAPRVTSIEAFLLALLVAAAFDPRVCQCAFYSVRMTGAEFGACRA